MKTSQFSQLSTSTVGMVIQSLTSGTRVGHVQHVGVVPFLFDTSTTSNQAIVFYLGSLHKTVIEIRGELQAEQKQSQPGSVTQVEKA